MPYLIDGHNLIAQLPDISLEDPDDEAKLVIKLRGFCASNKKRCIVIFDGGIPGGYSSMSNKSVKVIFASAFHTNADTLIKQRIHDTPDASNWTVVSSDNEVLDYARKYKMRARTSNDFATALKRKPRVQDSRGESTHVQVTSEEVDEWLDIFGDV